MESRFGWGRGDTGDDEDTKLYDDDSSDDDYPTGTSSKLPRDPSHLFKYSAEAAAVTQQSISSHELQQVIDS